MHVDRGVFCFGASLYLGAWAWYMLFLLLMYPFFFLWFIYHLWVVYVRGKHYILCFFYCFLFHIRYIGCWFILWGYSWYMSYFMFCEIKNLFVLLLFSTHAFMCLLSVSGIYRLIMSWLLSTLATDK